MRLLGRLLVSASMALAAAGQLAAAPPAFPGAQGFGVQTAGGRGGQLIWVTTLADSGPGSLRAACEATGPRTILFRVGGLIRLESAIKIRNGQLTLAGQSAPGDGICLAGYGFTISADDCIVRHMRFRPGDESRREQDALSVSGKRVVIDHCSTSWGIDETLSVTNSSDVTVCWCVISESLNRSYHKKGAHGYGSLVNGSQGGITFHHNLYAHHNSRNPRPGGKENEPGIVFDFRSNVIYDWGDRAGYSSLTAVRMNYVGNYLQPGPGTRPSSRTVAFSPGGVATRIYLHDNLLVDGQRDITDPVALLRLGSKGDFPATYTPADAVEQEPFASPNVSTEAPREALARVLAEAGATWPVRDAVDARIVEDVRQMRGGIINSQAEVGGWPEYRSATPAVDTDEDGLPDAWEKAHGFDAADPRDATTDADGDGYPQREEFLNRTDPRQAD